MCVSIGKQTPSSSVCGAIAAVKSRASAVLGPIYFRLLVLGEEPDAAFVEHVVGLIAR